jgi:hypothetical protein
MCLAIALLLVIRINLQLSYTSAVNTSTSESKFPTRSFTFEQKVDPKLALKSDYDSIKLYLMETSFWCTIYENSIE